MKRNIVIATIAAVALIGGGTATTIAVSGDDEALAKKTVTVSNDDNDRDDVNDTDDTAQDRAGDQAARATDQDAEDKAENAADAKAGQITAADAIRTALKHTTGTAVSADLDDEGTAHVWEVDVLTNGGAWHSIQIDPANGKVLGSHTEKDDAAETAQIRAALKGSSVTAAEAAEAAAAKGTVTSVDLDEESTDQAWEVDTTAADGTGSDWRVNPDSGRVTADRSND
jgi:uncharacterized membrane protein YkoI